MSHAPLKGLRKNPFASARYLNEAWHATIGAQDICTYYSEHIDFIGPNQVIHFVHSITLQDLPV